MQVWGGAGSLPPSPADARPLALWWCSYRKQQQAAAGAAPQGLGMSDLRAALLAASAIETLDQLHAEHLAGGYDACRRFATKCMVQMLLRLTIMGYCEHAPPAAPRPFDKAQQRVPARRQPWVARRSLPCLKIASASRPQAPGAALPCRRSWQTSCLISIRQAILLRHLLTVPPRLQLLRNTHTVACTPPRQQMIVATALPIPRAGHDFFNRVVMPLFGGLEGQQR